VIKRSDGKRGERGRQWNEKKLQNEELRGMN
jgi:hypothetical protein